MKIANRKVVWAHEPWTIIKIESPDVPEWYAFNTVTGERRKSYTSYDKAMDSILFESKYAEPWGV